MSTTIPHGNYLSVAEYAKLLGVSKSRIYQAIGQGKLKCYKIDNIIIIPKNAVIEYSRNRDGNLIGISKLKVGDIEGFLSKRGYRIK